MNTLTMIAQDLERSRDKVSNLKASLQETLIALEPFAAAYSSFTGLGDGVEVRLDGSFALQNGPPGAVCQTRPVRVTVGDMRRAAATYQVLKRIL